MIQSTSGTSMPRAATSVQMRTEARWKGERKHTLWLAELLHRACPAFLDHSSVERENASGLQARNVLQDGGKEVHGGAGEEEDDHLVGRVDLEKADELPLTETQRSYKAEFRVTRESDVVFFKRTGTACTLSRFLISILILTGLRKPARTSALTPSASVALNSPVRRCFGSFARIAPIVFVCPRSYMRASNRQYQQHVGLVQNENL